MLNNKWSKLLDDLHLFLLVISMVPIFLYAQDYVNEGLAIIGILIGLQCYSYVLGVKNKVTVLCLNLKLLFLSLYIILTGIWEISLLYYVIINPRNKSEMRKTCFIPPISVLVLWLLRNHKTISVPAFVISLFVITIVTLLLHGFEELIVHIQHKEYQLNLQIKGTALNELKVKNLNRELALKYQLADTNARLEERENIARNIHNVVGHTITSAIVTLQAYRVLNETHSHLADGKLNAATERMRMALDEIRRAVRVLDQDLELISIFDFCQILKTELQRFSTDTEIGVSHNLNEITEDIDVSKRYCEFLHATVTECLNNGIRHGNATSFVILLQCTKYYIELSVRDNGSGFKEISNETRQLRIKNGFGVRKMETFVLSNGGNIKITSDDGFYVKVGLPLYNNDLRGDENESN